MIAEFSSMKCYLTTIFIIIILHRVNCSNSLSQLCEHNFINGNKLYNFSLTSPLPKYPHGVLSEDGYYKVAVNESVLWFQLCDGMIFNHDPPRCIDCLDCGGPKRCGMGCSALVSNNIGGYDVCTIIGRASNTVTSILDKQNPLKGVIVKMSSTVKASGGSEHNCSLSVSVICNSNGAQEPNSLAKSGTCDYNAVLQHPSGCANIVSVHGQRLGWFSTLVILVVCLFGGYILVGAIYRYFFLGIHGLDMIPNLDFWARLPQRIQSSCASMVRRIRGPTERHRSSYSPVNF